MKEIIKELMKYIITFIGLVAIFNGLLYVVSLIPSDVIRENTLKSAESMIEEGQILNKGFFAFVDNGIDGLVLNEAYSIDSDSPVESYMLMRKNYKKGQTTIELGDIFGQLATYGNNKISKDGSAIPDEEYDTARELYNFINGKVNISQRYTRYYHGYIFFIRPLLVWLNVNGIRILMLLVHLVELCAFSYLMNKKLGIKNAIIYTTLLISFGYLGIAQSLQSGPLFFCIMISLIFLLLNIEKIDKKYLMYYLFIVGSIANFVDFLTVPVLSLFLPLAIVYTYNNQNNDCLKLKKETLLKTFLDVVILGIVWSLGYILTWASKVVLVGYLFDKDGISSATNQVAFRIFGTVEYSKPKYIVSTIDTFLVVVNSIVIEILVLKLFKKCETTKIDKKLLCDNFNLILAGTIPVAWMVLLYNHTLYHFILYPYRNVLGPVLIFSLLKYGDLNNKLITQKNNKTKA